jgi:transposase-like protein
MMASRYCPYCPYCGLHGVTMVEGKSRPHSNGYKVVCTACGRRFIGFFDKKPKYYVLLGW